MAVTAAEIRAILTLQDQLSGQLSKVQGELHKLGASATASGNAARSAGSGWASLASAATDAGAKAAGVGPKIVSSLSAVPNAMGAVVRGFGAIGLAAQGVQATVGAAKSIGNSVFGLGALNEIEQVRASINAFTKDGAKTEEIIADIRKEAKETPFAFNEVAKATASLMPVAKGSGVSLQDLRKEAMILAASNPLEGLEGASFSLREAMTGDFTSIIERFNLSRSTINKLKDEGVPNIEIVRRAMAEMGFDWDLVAAKAETLDGRWSTFMDTVTELSTRMGQPIFDAMKDGLVGLQGFLDNNMKTFEGWADNVAGFIKTAIGAAKDLFDVFMGGDSFDGATEALSKIFPPALVDFIVEGARQLGDAWRTVQQVFAGEWEASDSIDPLVNAIGMVAVVIRDQVIPAVLTVAGFIIEQFGTTVAWVQENWPLILATFQTVWNTLVAVVQAVWPVVQAVISLGLAQIRDALKLIMQVITGDWSGAWTTLQGMVQRSLDAIAAVVGPILSAVGELFTSAALSVIETVTGWMDGIKSSIQGGMDAVSTAISDAWNAIKASVSGILPAIAQAILSVWNAIPEDIRADLVLIATHIVTAAATWVTNLTTAGSNMLTAITTKLNEIVTAVTTWATDTFITPITGLAATAGTAATTVGEGMRASIGTKLAEIVAAVQEWADSTFLAPLRGLVETARGVAASIGQSIIDGVSGAVRAGGEAVSSAIAGVVRGALQAAKDALGIASPSKRAADEIGKPFAEGIVAGMESMAPEMAARVRDFLDASMEYVPVAGEIARVEKEIAAIRSKAQTDALFRAKEMITIDSEALRLKKEMAIAERGMLPIRQALARASREVENISRGSLGDRQSMIGMDGKRKEIRLQIIDLERQLIGMDSDSKKAQGIQKQIDKLQDQDRLLSLEAERIQLTNEVAATGARIKREALDDQVRGQEDATAGLREQLAVLGAEQAVVQALEAIIDNALKNEIAERERLIAVFRAEAQPILDRIQAGLLYVDQLEAEGVLTKEQADKLREVGKNLDIATAGTKALGNAAEASEPQIDAATKKAEEMAKAGAKIAGSYDKAVGKVKELGETIGKVSTPFIDQDNPKGRLQRRAGGGPVVPRDLYLVGERGPELFVPDSAGSILPADATASLLDGSSGGSTGRGGGSGATREIHLHMEGAQIYGMSDFESAVQRAVGRGLKRGQFGG